MATPSSSEEKTVLPPAEQESLNRIKSYITFPVFLAVAFTFFLGVGAGFIAGNISDDTHIIIAPSPQDGEQRDRGNDSDDRKMNGDGFRQGEDTDDDITPSTSEEN